jgi:hypothetical protein
MNHCKQLDAPLTVTLGEHDLFTEAPIDHEVLSEKHGYNHPRAVVNPA